MMAVLVSILYCFVIYYIRKTAKLNMKQWDFNTVTSGDFTVKIEITKEMWDAFLEKYHDKIKNDNYHFKQYLAEQIRSQMEKFYT